MLQNYLKLLKKIINNHDIPVSLFTDRHISLSLTTDKLSIENQLAGKIVP